MNYTAEPKESYFSGATARSQSVASTQGEDNFAQHFIKNLHRKLRDPSLLQVCPPPPPEFFRHNDKNDAVASTDRATLPAAPREPYQGHPEAWGSPKHPFAAPPGSYKILSSDYAWLDAARQPARRDGAPNGGKPDMGLDGEATPEEVPEPPLFMQRTRFLAHGRLVFVKLRQQLEEICVGAVRRIETAASPSALPTENVSPTLSAMPSFTGSVATAALTNTRSIGATSWGGASFSATSGMGSGAVGLGSGIRGLPPGLVDEIIESVRDKLGAAFEDCLSDTMDQLWGVLQYAGSKHALVDRMSEAMRQREAELEAAFAKYREEAGSRLRSLRRQKEEIEAAADKDRTELRALAAAASQRVDFLEKDLAVAKAALDKERTQVAAKVEAQRTASEAALQAKDDAIEAFRADSAARIEELRVLNADLQQQLHQKTEEVEKLSVRTTDQADMLALALARRDGTFAELEVVSGQLADFKKFITASIRLPLTQWLRTMKEGDVPLTPLIGGPLSMEYGTGRAFVASARNLNLHAVLEELRRVMPKELPWPEEGWPPDGQEESMCDEETATSFSPMSESPPHTRSPSPSGSRDMPPRHPYAPTLPITWHRFMRAPLGDIMSPKDLMVQLTALAKAKWEADKVARRKGLPTPDLHAFVYKRFLAIHRAAVDADEEVVNLVQSLKTHSKTLSRAAIWLQLLQLSSPVLPLDACAYYLELFHALLDNPSRSSPNVVDKATGTVWVSPARWKALLTGEFMQVFDTERKAMLLKQAASVRVDTNRGNKTFGLSDVDSLMEVVMGVWLAQRQAAMSELALSWTAVEPVGGGVLAVNMDVDQLTKIAAHALGPGVLPNDREVLLDIYFSTVQAARLSQATARVKWSGLTTAALGTALAAMELLPPRPFTPRGSPAVSRLNAAASLLFQIADPAVEEMRSQPAFRMSKAMEALDVSLGRLRRELQACDREELGGPRSEAEEEAAVAAGWAAAEAATAALLAAREAYRGFEANVRDHMIKMAVDAALEKHRGEGSDGRRMSSSRHRLTSRNFRTSNLSGDGMPDSILPRASGRYSISGGNNGPPQQRRLSARCTGRPSHRPLSGVAPRDLRAVLASAAWSSDGEDLTTGVSMDGGAAPPRLQLRGRFRMQPGPGESVVRSLNGEGSESNMPSAPPLDRGGLAAGGGDTASAANVTAVRVTVTPGNDGGGGLDIAAAADDRERDHGYGRGTESDTGGGVAVAAVHAGEGAVTASTAKGGEGEGCVSEHHVTSQELDPESDLMQRLAELEGRYVRLRSRHDETKRTIHAAYVAAAASDPSGAGLPSPEVLAEMGPASKLRLVAELLAELHQEVEQGVWPHLDDTVRAAITSMMPRGGGSGSRRQSRRSLSSVMPPGLRMSVRPSRLSSITAMEAVAAADTDVDFTPRAPARASSTAEPAFVATPLSPAGALGVQGSAVSSVMPAEGVEIEESVYEGVGMAVVEEEGQEDQDGAEDGEEPHPAEVAEVAGRLHAHAGHVGQVMAAAALETAALAAALEDLTSWKSSPSHSTSTRWHSGIIGDGLFRNGSGEAGGNGYSSDSAAPLWAGGHLGIADFGAPGGSLHRSSVLPRLQSARVPPLPLGTLGNWLQDSHQNSARDSSRSSHTHSDGGGGGTVRTTSGVAALGEDVRMNPWDAVPVEADPRDTAYLDALRSLHMAAEAQSATEGNIGPLVKAVQEVVRLLGGQPKITGNGRVIEFFPRRVPTGKLPDAVEPTGR
ncbi:hypothetical protein Vafri_151 [Volvox africanus]|nr:hypothetical protein Vafri_151 [Volvox africanus]